MKKFILPILTIMVISCTSKITPPKTVGDAVSVEIVNLSATKAADISFADQNLAFDMFHKLGDKCEASTFISPLSLSLALSMTAMGAEGETYDEMAKVLGHEGFTVEELGTYYNQLINRLSTADKKVIFESANAIWVDNPIVLNKPFVCLTEGYYCAAVASADMSDPATARSINDWVSSKTHKMIEKIVDDTSDWRVALVNAVYFKSPWKEEFNQMKGFEFTDINGRTSQVDAMRASFHGSYSEDSHFRMAELRYGSNGSFVMDVLMPKKGLKSDLPYLNAESWNALLKNVEGRQVHFRMPEFEVSYGSNMSDALRELGMGRAFSSSAQFGRMSDWPLCIDVVIQKAKIIVNHKGTEAAASTLVGMKDAACAPEDPVEFFVDRPFIYILRESHRGEILFIGNKLN